MSIPLITDIQTLDFVFDGEPFLRAAAQSGVLLATMDYVFDGEPLGGADYASNLHNTSIAQTGIRKAQVLDTDVWVGTNATQTITHAGQSLDAFIDVSKNCAIAQTTSKTQQALSTISEERTASIAQTIPKTKQSIATGLTVQVTIAQTTPKTSNTISAGKLAQCSIAQKAPKAQHGAIAHLVGHEDAKDTLFLAILGFVDAKDTVSIHVIPNSFSPNTDYTNVSNTWKATFKFDGVVYSQHPETTPPGGLDSIQNYLPRVDWNAIGDIGDCKKLMGFQVQLNFDGGSWRLETLESSISGTTFFGLEGVLTNEGWEYRSGKKVYIYEGIFGNLKLNRPVQLFARTYTYRGDSGKFLTDLYVQSLTMKKWNNISEAAKAIAKIADIDLQWIAQDAPLFEMYLESGMTVRGAIQGLASRVKANLIWTGTNYVVAPEDKFIGSWLVPHCKLITDFKFRNIKDLKPYENILFPTEPPGGGESNVVFNYRKPVPIKTIGDCQRLDPKEPDKLIPISDPGFDTLHSRMVTNSITTGTGVISQGQIKALDDAGLANQAWFGLVHGAVYTDACGQKFIQISHDNFSVLDGANDDVNKGNCKIEVGYKPKLDELRDIVKQEADLILSQSLANERARLAAIQSVLVSEGSLGVTFFGSLPMPGMLCTGQIGADIVQGIARQISFTAPQQLSITLGNYNLFNFYQPLSGVTVLQTAPRPA